MLSFTKITTLLLLAIATPSLVGAHLSPAQLTIWSEHAKRADAQLAGCDPKQVAERRARSLARRLKFVEEKRAELGFKNVQSRSLDPRVANEDSLKLDSLTCILAPEVTAGPFYVAGEHVRPDNRDGQTGMPLYLDMEFINTMNCKPVDKLLVDVWSANATGVYSARPSQGGLKTNFLRSVAITNRQGHANMTTIWPGHYDGRATHVHIATHSGAKLRSDRSWEGGHFSHSGQIFFPQNWIDPLETYFPYNTNTQKRMKNSDDPFFNYQNSRGYNAIAKMSMITSNPYDGIFAYIEVGFDDTANHDKDMSWDVVMTPDGPKLQPGHGA